MRKFALLLAAVMVVSSPSLALAKKAKRAAKPAAPPAQTFENLNKDTIKMFHDVFVWPSK